MDKAENVCYFGDPDLRLFTPETKYSDNNYWGKDETNPLRYDEDLSINGHMPYGATSYPHETTPMPWMQYIWILIVVAAIAVVGIAGFMFFRKRN